MHLNSRCWTVAGKNGKHRINTNIAGKKHIALLTVLTVHFMMRPDFMVALKKEREINEFSHLDYQNYRI